MSFPGIPCYQLPNGQIMPRVGLGTWQSEENKVYDAVCTAISTGYRLFDCAFVYANQDEIGRALNESGLKREEFFVITKLWNTFHRPDLVKPHLQHSLKLLMLDYVDHFMVHWPTAYKPGDDLFPKDEKGEFIPDDQVTLEETWAAFEELVTSGLAKSIGVCNFNQRHLSRILKCCKIPPACLQIEMHPYLQQQELVDFAQKNGILVISYSPLGSPGTTSDLPAVIEDPVIKRIAQKHKVSPGQVLLRFELERGCAVIPKSVTPSRIEENFHIFDFHLDDEDMNEIRALDKSIRYIVPQEAANHPEFPFPKSELPDERKKALSQHEERQKQASTQKHGAKKTGKSGDQPSQQSKSSTQKSAGDRISTEKKGEPRSEWHQH